MTVVHAKRVTMHHCISLQDTARYCKTFEPRFICLQDLVSTHVFGHCCIFFNMHQDVSIWISQSENHSRTFNKLDGLCPQSLLSFQALNLAKEAVAACQGDEQEGRGLLWQPMAVQND